MASKTEEIRTSVDKTVYFDEKLNKHYLPKNDVKSVYYFDSKTNSTFRVNKDDDAIEDKVYLNIISEKAKKQFELLREGVVCMNLKRSLNNKMNTAFTLRTTVSPNEEVLVQKDVSGKPWFKARVVEFIRERREVIVELLPQANSQYSRSNRFVRIIVPFHRIAYFVPQYVNLAKAFRIVAKVIAKGAKVNYLSGRILDLAKKSNNFRYLVYFEGGITSYVAMKDVSIILDQSRQFENFNSFQREFISYYFKCYPEVPTTKFKIGDKTLLRLKMPNQPDEIYVRATGVVQRIDCKLVQFHVPSHNTHVWLFRGDYTRILKIESDSKDGPKRHRPIRNIGSQSRNIIEVTLDDDLNEVNDETAIEDQQQATPIEPATNLKDKPIPAEKEPDIETKIILDQINRHTCSGNCLNPKEHENFVPANLNLYVVPIFFGWFRLFDVKYDHSKQYFYLSPCGIKFYDIEAIFDYLQLTGSKLQIDQFNLDREFVIEEKESHYLGFHVFLNDISNGKENQAVSLINTINLDTLDNYQYISEREFNLKNFEIVLNKNFMVCCDCTDNCRNPERCACQRLTMESAQPVHELKEYPIKNRILNQKILSGIYECNDGCACKTKREQCVNRNVQLGLRNKLQLFKTINKGWGVRTLHDIPKGKINLKSNRFSKPI